MKKIYYLHREESKSLVCFFLMGVALEADKGLSGGQSKYPFVGVKVNVLATLLQVPVLDCKQLLFFSFQQHS